MFVKILEEGAPGTAPPPQAGARTGDTSGPRPTEAPGVRRTIEGVLAAEQRIDAILDAVKSGKTFSAAELLAMQSTVFRYSQTVEIMSRAADRLVGAIKQTLGTQV